MDRETGVVEVVLNIFAICRENYNWRKTHQEKSSVDYSGHGVLKKILSNF